jgi:hypothetical protein
MKKNHPSIFFFDFTIPQPSVTAGLVLAGKLKTVPHK